MKISMCCRKAPKAGRFPVAIQGACPLLFPVSKLPADAHTICVLCQLPVRPGEASGLGPVARMRTHRSLFIWHANVKSEREALVVAGLDRAATHAAPSTIR